MRRCSRTTIIGRRNILARVQRLVPVPLAQASPDDIEAWLATRAGSVTDGTLAEEVTVLRVY